MKKRQQDAHDQPMPTPTHGPAIVDLVLADIVARDRIGQQRYGTRLQAHNGRNALRDAYEEALDLAIYLRQCLEEMPKAEPMVTYANTGNFDAKPGYALTVMYPTWSRGNGIARLVDHDSGDV